LNGTPVIQNISPMKITFYKLHPDRQPLIRPAGRQREWMDKTPESYAYRCLPLNIANMHGWEILSPCSFVATWDGTPAPQGVSVQSAAPPHLRPVGLFGSGVLTFHLGLLFRTEPGFNMMTTGPINAARDGVQALTGVIETDWAPYEFTMNWRFTRPNHAVYFQEGDPIAHVFPVRRGAVEDIEPEVKELADDPELYANYKRWSESRNAFSEQARIPGTQANKERWQKLYYRGLMPDGSAGCPAHQTKLRPPGFSGGAPRADKDEPEEP
jgi:hypothetical protein